MYKTNTTKVKETISKEGEQKISNEFQTSNSKSQTRACEQITRGSEWSAPPAIFTKPGGCATNLQGRPPSCCSNQPSAPSWSKATGWKWEECGVRNQPEARWPPATLNSDTKVEMFMIAPQSSPRSSDTTPNPNLSSVHEDANNRNDKVKL